MSQHLEVFNTLTRRNERFQPLEPGRVKMFVCGPTVQSLIHIGHARTYVFYDVVARYLAHLGYEVTFLMNITDLDERITQAAADSKEDPVALARRFAASFREDMTLLNNATVTRFEPVSGHVQTMVQQVATLIDIGRAYAADGWVFFDTTTFPSFGRLSHQSKRDLSLRPLELSPKKRHLADFGLWRPEVLLEGRWESPWGVGSPGWHIQDTAVTLSILGPQYDIHGGAYELVYPHHEAEIAQAESLTGIRPVVKYWIHTSLVNMKGRKMSKSLGNVLTVRDALREFSADELRIFLLGTHYRKDMGLKGMDAAAERLQAMRRAAEGTVGDVGFDSGKPRGPKRLRPFESAMNDDFDTPRAISWAEKTLKEAERGRDPGRRTTQLESAVAALRILGVDLFAKAK